MARMAAAWAMLGAAVPVARLPAQDTVHTARVVGRVVDSTGAPVARAEVMVKPGTGLRVVTNDSGDFEFPAAPSGRVEFLVRRLGYQPGSFDATLKPGIAQHVTLPLTAVIAELPGILVEDTVTHPWLRVFERHRHEEYGTFFTRADIVKSQARITSDLLRRVPGVMFANVRGSLHVLFTRGGRMARPCEPAIFVHHIAYSGVLDDFTPDDIEAIEVYTGISTVPAELWGEQAHTCGAIVLWTREPPQPGKP
jgi:hypothetical protein